MNNNNIIQSVIFKKSAYTIPDAISWLNNHHMKTIKIDITSNFYRCRQIKPLDLKNLGFTHYITKKIDDGNIELIIAYK